MKKLQVLVLLVIVTLIFVACSSKEPSIVGEWHSEKDNVTMLINEDGTFSVLDKSVADADLMEGTYRIDGNKFLFTPTHEMELTNTFELKGDKLILTYQNYSTEFTRVKN